MKLMKLTLFPLALLMALGAIGTELQAGGCGKGRKKFRQSFLARLARKKAFEAAKNDKNQNQGQDAAKNDAAKQDAAKNDAQKNKTPQRRFFSKKQLRAAFARWKKCKRNCFFRRAKVDQKNQQVNNQNKAPQVNKKQARYAAGLYRRMNRMERRMKRMEARMKYYQARSRGRWGR